MSRTAIKLTKHITIIFGKDHAIGRFWDITDSRYADTPEDEQGEGYVFEFNEAFGISTNLIGLDIDNFTDLSIIQQKCNEKYGTVL